MSSRHLLMVNYYLIARRILLVAPNLKLNEKLLRQPSQINRRHKAARLRGRRPRSGALTRMTMIFRMGRTADHDDASSKVLFKPQRSPRIPQRHAETVIL